MSNRLVSIVQRWATSPGGSMSLLSQPGSVRNMVWPRCFIIQKQSVGYINDPVAVWCFQLQGKKWPQTAWHVAVCINRSSASWALVIHGFCEQKDLNFTPLTAAAHSKGFLEWAVCWFLSGCPNLFPPKKISLLSTDELKKTYISAQTLKLLSKVCPRVKWLVLTSVSDRSNSMLFGHVSVRY